MTPPVEPAARPPLVLAGIPRSGTTWSMRVLACDHSLLSVMEPDNEGRSGPAIWAKRSTGRFPVLAPGDHDERYQWLWSWIMDGAPDSARLEASRQILRAVRPGERRRFLEGRWAPLMGVAGLLGARPPRQPAPGLSAHRLLVKTVFAPMSIGWIADLFDVEVLALFRHPGNVLSSWISLDLHDQYVHLEQHPVIKRRIGSGELPVPGEDPLERLVWQLGVINLVLEESVAQHPDWVVRTHEELCDNPIVQFQRLYADLGLTWNEDAERYLTKNDRPGEGYPTQRVASDQPDAWKSKLTLRQIDVIRRVLAQFPLTTWSDADFAP